RRSVVAPIGGIAGVRGGGIVAPIVGVRVRWTGLIAPIARCIAGRRRSIGKVLRADAAFAVRARRVVSTATAAITVVAEIARVAATGGRRGLLRFGIVVEGEAWEIETRDLGAASTGKAGEQDGGGTARWLGERRSLATETHKTHHDTHLYCQPSINP